MSSAVAEAPLLPTGARSNEPGAWARAGPESRAAAGPPPRSAPVWAKSDAELLHTLDVQPGASDWRGQRADTPSYGLRQIPISPSGPSHGDRSPRPARRQLRGPFATRPVCLISPERSARTSSAGANLLVMGATSTSIGLGEVVDRLRSNRVDVLVVDMGWPSATDGTPMWPPLVHRF